MWLFVLIFTVFAGFASIQSAWFPHSWSAAASPTTTVATAAINPPRVSPSGGEPLVTNTAEARQEEREKEYRESIERLRNQIATQKRELLQGLKPPEASLIFTLAPPKEQIYPGKPFNPVTSQVTRLNPDGTFRLTLTAVNNGSVASLEGQAILKICAECEFTREPDNFVRVPDLGAKARGRMLPELQAETRWTFFDDYIRVGALMSERSRITLELTYRCRNCKVVLEPEQFTVDIK